MDNISQFFSSDAFAVIGASKDRSKFGNKVLRCYLTNDRVVYPVNPNEPIIEGLNCTQKIENLPDHVKSISIVTPPNISEKMVDDAIQFGVKNIWFQPGSESEKAIKKCKEHDINVIANGKCILAISGFKETKGDA